jgi:hypothetical protein
MVKDFDLHKRAEVDGSLRGVERDKDVSAARFGRLAIPLREDGLQELIRVGEGYAEHGDFVGYVHGRI